MIRDFIETDLEEYVQLSQDFYHSGAVDHPVPEEYFRRTFAECLRGSPYVRGLVFVLDRQLAGFALLSLTWSNEAGGICVLLEEAYITPENRGKGIGSAFFAFVDREYAGRAKRFRLEVAPANERAVQLYNRMGFQPLDYFQMIKELE